MTALCSKSQTDALPADGDTWQRATLSCRLSEMVGFDPSIEAKWQPRPILASRLAADVFAGRIWVSTKAARTAARPFDAYIPPLRPPAIASSCLVS